MSHIAPVVMVRAQRRQNRSAHYPAVNKYVALLKRIGNDHFAVFLYDDVHAVFDILEELITQ